MGHRESRPRRKIYSITGLLKKQKKSHIQFNITSKGTRGQGGKTQSKVSRRKERKIRVEINASNKKTITVINESLRAGS